MGLNGDLYFSHAVEKDSGRDYCCFASFPRIRTIVQKTAMSVIVKTSRCLVVFFVSTRLLFASQTSVTCTLILEHCSFTSTFADTVVERKHFKSHPSVTLFCLCASFCFYDFYDVTQMLVMCIIHIFHMFIVCVCFFFLFVCVFVFLVSSVMILGKSDSSENGKLY